MRPPHWWTLLTLTLRFVLRSPLEVRLVRAVRAGRLAQVQKLLDTGRWQLSWPTTPSPLSYNRYLNGAHKGHTLLHLAAEEGQFEVVECLLARGANPNAYTGWGISVVQSAAMNGHAAVVALLAQHGADVLRKLPSTSTFDDGLDFGPTSAEMLKTATGVEYQGHEHLTYRASQLQQALPGAPAQSNARPRF